MIIFYNEAAITNFREPVFVHALLRMTVTKINDGITQLLQSVF